MRSSPVSLRWHRAVRSPGPARLADHGKDATGGRLNAYKAVANSTVGVSNGVLTYDAGTGVSNRLTISQIVSGGATKLRVRDPFTAGKPWSGRNSGLPIEVT
jgi:hypothetical protein